VSLKITNLVGFSGVPKIGPVEPTHDGNFAPSSGLGNPTHTYNSRTSTGPRTYLHITWRDASGITLNTVIFGGNSMSRLVEEKNSAGARNGAEIWDISGSQSGNILLGFSGTCDDSHISIVSLRNVKNPAPIDTDTDFTNAAQAFPLELTALNNPGEDGIILIAHAHSFDFLSQTFFPFTVVEIADLDAGAHRHCAGWNLGDLGDNLETNAWNTYKVLVGVSLR